MLLSRVYALRLQAFRPLVASWGALPLRLVDGDMIPFIEGLPIAPYSASLPFCEVDMKAGA